MKGTLFFFDKILLTSVLVTFVSSCANNKQIVADEFPISEGHIQASASSSHDTPEKELPETLEFSLPPPEVDKEELFTVVVADVPATKLLFALARDAERNIDVHPTIEGKVTLNAIDQTLFQILDRISKQIDIRYRIEGELITILPDTPYLKSYDINILNIQRKSGSTVTVATEVSSTGTSIDGENSLGNISNTNIVNASNNYFWESLMSNLNAILRGGDSDQRNDEDSSTGSSESSSASESVEGEGDDGNSLEQNNSVSIIANREAGIISIRASHKQHLEVAKYIANVVEHAQRQVVIEATIAEVTLNDRYQAGVDWSRFAETGKTGFSFEQSLIGSNLSTNPFLSIAYDNTTGTPWQSSVKLLNQFGDTKVLSSPKIMVMNNQTAILKVVENKVYFDIEVQKEEDDDGDESITIDSNIKTVPVGFVMAVTPQISGEEVVTINARPTISRIVGFAEDPGPKLIAATLGSGSTDPVLVQNLVPEIQVREVESILKISSGDIGIIGGLMEDTIDSGSDGVPGLAKLPFIGNAFKYKDDDRKKTELVIFIRPVVVKHASLNKDLSEYKKFLIKEKNKKLKNQEKNLSLVSPRE